MSLLSPGWHGRMEHFHWALLVWGSKEVAPPQGGVVLGPPGRCSRGPTGWSTTHDSVEAMHGGVCRGCDEGGQQSPRKGEQNESHGLGRVPQTPVWKP